MRYSPLALLALLIMPISMVEGGPTIVFRGHVGAVSGKLVIVWVEKVVEGPLQEGGVIEVLRGDGCSGSPIIDEVKVGDFVEVRGSLEVPRCRKVVMLECGDHYLRVLMNVLEAGIRLLYGCDSEVEGGRNVTFVFFISRDAYVTISLKKDNETKTLFQGYLKAGLYSIEREEGREEGEREVCILADAESRGDYAFSCCRYKVVSGKQKLLDEEYRNLTVRVLTEAGYPVKNASVYIDGKLYGFTDRRGFLKTNISEGMHEVRVESECYRTAVVRTNPKLVVVMVGVKAPEVRLYFHPDEINGSGNVKLVVERLGGADISIRVKLTPLGSLKVNATELVGVPPFNATLQVRGEGKLVASYGKVNAVLTSRVVGPKPRSESTATGTQPKTTSASQVTTAKDTKTGTSATEPETPEMGVERSPFHWAYSIAFTLIVFTLLILTWMRKRSRKGTSPPGSAGSTPD